MRTLVVAGALALLAAGLVRTPAVAQSRVHVLDRTFVCTPSLIGGIRQIDTRAHRGSGRRGPSWNQPAFAGVETTVSGAAQTAIEDELVWVSAGRPSPSATVVTTLVGFTFPFRSWGRSGSIGRAAARALPASRCRGTG